MIITDSIAFFVALNLLVIGLSHSIRPDIWGEFFNYLHQKGNVGNIINALLSVAMGTIVLSFHFIWEWPSILITLYGAHVFVKGLIYLLFPEIGLKSIAQVEGKEYKFRWVGLVMTLFSLLIIYDLFIR